MKSIKQNLVNRNVNQLGKYFYNFISETVFKIYREPHRQRATAKVRAVAVAGEERRKRHS